MLVSSEVMAGVNYCVIEPKYMTNCQEYDRLSPNYLLREDAFVSCCDDKETYEEFLKVKSK